MNVLRRLNGNFRFSKSLFSSSSYFIYKLLIGPKYSAAENSRREFVTNVVLVASSSLLLVYNILLVFGLVPIPHYRNFFVLAPALALMVLAFLLWVSRKGHTVFSVYGLLAVYFVAVSYVTYKWGISPPEVLFCYGILIVASMLISARFSLAVAIAVGALVNLLSFIESRPWINSNRYWLYQRSRLIDIASYIVILILFIIVSRLSDRQAAEILRQSRALEAELKKQQAAALSVREQDISSDEIQLRQIAELSRLAKFGRLAFGLFHDLINPLTALSLNLDRATKEARSLKIAGLPLGQAVVASKRLEKLLFSVRKQMKGGCEKEFFSPESEIREVLSLLSYKLRKARVRAVFCCSGSVKMYGSPSKFCQIVMNLISNAVESYAGFEKREIGRVAVCLRREEDWAVVEVSDCGCGIFPENIEVVFEPFFTTKAVLGGMGIGLCTVKELAEKEFGGSVRVSSKLGQGSLFVVRLKICG